MTNMKRMERRVKKTRTRAELLRVIKSYPARYVPVEITMDTNFNKAKQTTIVALKANRMLMHPLTLESTEIINVGGAEVPLGMLAKSVTDPQRHSCLYKFQSFYTKGEMVNNRVTVDLGVLGEISIINPDVDSRSAGVLIVRNPINESYEIVKGSMGPIKVVFGPVCLLFPGHDIGEWEDLVKMVLRDAVELNMVFTVLPTLNIVFNGVEYSTPNGILSILGLLLAFELVVEPIYSQSFKVVTTIPGLANFKCHTHGLDLEPLHKTINEHLSTIGHSGYTQARLAILDKRRRSPQPHHAIAQRTTI